MPEQTAAATAATHAASQQARPGALTGPPHRRWNARFALVAFGLLLTASLAIPAVAEVAPMPGGSLVFLGLMLLLGVAELLEAGSRRLVIALRIAGMVISLLGLVVQLVPGLG